MSERPSVLLKDTSLVAYLPLAELFFQLTNIGARTFQIFPMLVAATLWYLAMTSVLMVGQYFLERRFSRGVASRTGGRAKPTPVPVGGLGGMS